MDEEINVKSKESLLLDVTFRCVLENIVNKVSAEKFTDIFGYVCNNNMSVVTKLHKAFQKTVVTSSLDELNWTVQEEDVGDSMKRLAALVKGAGPTGSSAWRPPGNVKAHMCSLDAQQKMRRSLVLEEAVLKREEDVADKRQQLEQEMAALASQQACTLPRLECVHGQVAELRDCLHDLEACLLNCVPVPSALSLLPDVP